VPPRRRTKPIGIAAVPERAADHIVAVAQGRDAAAYSVAGIAADEAAASISGAGDAGDAIPPSRRSAIAVPEGAGHRVVGVAQGRDVEAQPTDLVTRVAADEAVAGVHGPSDADSAVPPRHRPACAVPVRAADHIVAVAQGCSAEGAHSVIGVAADEA